MSVPTTKTLFIILLLVGLVQAQIKLEPLPSPTTDNAVTGVWSHGSVLLYSFMGLGEKKTPDAIAPGAYEIDLSQGSWNSIHAVPGTVGRIAASAIGVRDHIFLFGGYVVDSQGNAMTVPDVNAYEPSRNRWFRSADIPVPVGDAVIGAIQDRYIYLIGGRSNQGPVTDVQIYDAEKNTWTKGTPMAGSPVFGHAGGIVGDTIVYIGGAKANSEGKPKYVPSDECWIGKVDRHDRTKITWSKLPPHPGNASYRIAGGPSERDQTVFFSGGTDNPYDISGVGYDGKPAEPSPVTFAYDIRSAKWETINENTPDPTMDHRALVSTSEGLILIGGMEGGQKVTARVVMLSKKPAGNKK